MAPVIHCVRHAQGFHNISIENLGIPDPSLTPFGEQQCAALASSFPSHARISLVVASPLKRTLQTAILSFSASLSNGRCDRTIVALPEAQETSDLVSDTGSDVTQLRQLCQENHWPVDLSLVQAGWNMKELEKWAPTREAISNRAREARLFLLEKIQALQAQGEESPEIVFVTHGGFLHYFTEDWEGSGVDTAYQTGQLSEIAWDIPGTAWRNTEVRSYNIVSCKDETGDDAQLSETSESRRMRGIDGFEKERISDISLLQKVAVFSQVHLTREQIPSEFFLRPRTVQSGLCQG